MAGGLKSLKPPQYPRQFASQECETWYMVMWGFGPSTKPHFDNQAIS